MTPPRPVHSNPGVHRHESITAYLVVYLLLMVLLGITIAAAFIDVGPLALAIAMLIAAVKSALVVLYFMHVRLSTPLTKLFVVAGIFWLGILFVLTFTDYLTRGWLPFSSGWTERLEAPPPADPERGPGSRRGEGAPVPIE